MISFLKIEPEARSTWNGKVRLFFKCLLLSFLVKITGTLILTIASLAGLKTISTLYSKETKLSDYFSLETTLLLMIVVYPILEELAFRGWFSRNKKLVAISLTALLFYILYISIYKLFPEVLPFESLGKNLFIAFFLVTGLVYFYFHASRFQKAIADRYNTLILISILAFSGIHILNFNFGEINLETVIGMALIILPYPFAAYIYTFIRIKSGLPWSMVLHVLDNSLILIGVLAGRTNI